MCLAGSALAERAAAEGFDVAEKITRDADIVHSHTGRAHNHAVRATLGSGVLRIVTRHVSFAPKHPLIHRLKYSRTCHGIIAVSGAVRRVLLASGIPQQMIQVIHTGVAAPASLPTSAERAVARQKLGLEAGHFVVGHLGAFTQEKGQDVAVAAARIMQPDTRYAQVRMLLGGDGPLRDTLAKDAPAMVHFPGHIEDRDVFYAALDLFVMPSRSEAWGLAVLEAMALGVPVIASDVGGLTEIVEPGKSGWLVTPGDAEALAAAIREAMEQDDLLNQYAQGAHERAARYSVEAMAEQTEVFYRKMKDAHETAV